MKRFGQNRKFHGKIRKNWVYISVYVVKPLFREIRSKHLIFRAQCNFFLPFIYSDVGIRL